jgi:hypothetical protein
MEFEQVEYVATSNLKMWRWRDMEYEKVKDVATSCLNDGTKLKGTPKINLPVKQT